MSSSRCLGTVSTISVRCRASSRIVSIRSSSRTPSAIQSRVGVRRPCNASITAFRPNSRSPLIRIGEDDFLGGRPGEAASRSGRAKGLVRPARPAGTSTGAVRPRAGRLPGRVSLSFGSVRGTQRAFCELLPCFLGFGTESLPGFLGSPPRSGRESVDCLRGSGRPFRSVFRGSNRDFPDRPVWGILKGYSSLG